MRFDNFFGFGGFGFGGHGFGGGHRGKGVDIELSQLATFDSGLGEGAAEIVAHDPETQRLFVTNSETKTVDILDISDPSNPTKINSIDVGEINGVETGGPIPAWSRSTTPMATSSAPSSLARCPTWSRSPRTA